MNSYSDILNNELIINSLKSAIKSGRVNHAYIFDGEKGIGKTSLAAQCPDPVFIDTEGGTAHLDVRRLQKPDDWEKLIALIKEVAANPGVCKTLVYSTLFMPPKTV